jgi:Cu/Ag efflux protein CusF
MQKLFAVAFAVAGAFSHAAWANDAHHPAAGDAIVSEAAGFAANEGEIRKVDKAQGKLTLKHGPLPNLEMPGMTMVFRVKDQAMLEKVAVGDKVAVQVEKVNGQLTVTQLERKN